MKKILIADDAAVNVKLVSEILKSRYDIITAYDGSSCMKTASEQKPDLILLDVVMPDMNGYDVCRGLRSDPVTSHIPVIFITSRKDLDDVVMGFEAGGVDYITKPFNSAELIARVETHLALVSMSDDMRTYSESLEFISQQLLEKTKLLDTMVRTDFLTGLSNRRHILEQMKSEEARMGRGTPVCSVIIADIDHFKKINDTYGHETGDLVLKTVAEIFRKNTRKQDVVARWGGEEFLFLLPETPGQAAFKLAEKIRAAIEDELIDGRLRITISLGVAEFDMSLSIDGTIRLADNALYEGKARGRNRVEMALSGEY